MDFCPRCGNKLQPNWKFCPICGFDFLQNKGLELVNNEANQQKMIEKPEPKSLVTPDENDVNNIRSFSLSLGKLFGQIGGYSIIQIIASLILAFMTVGMAFSIAYETSPSAMFNAFQSTMWTILISSILIEGISYIFIIKLITLLKRVEKQAIPFRDNYRKSALFFILGIIAGGILFVVAIILMNWLLQLIGEIFNNPSFDIEDLEQLPSTDIISTLVQIGRTSLSLVGYYYLQKNFKLLNFYMRNGQKVHTGFQLLVIGFLIMILGNLIGLAVDLGGFIGLVGLILTIIGYFKASDGLKNTLWTNPE